MQSMRFVYCPMCGARLQVICPDGDQRCRDVCLQCGYVHYANPLLVVGTVPIWQGRVLLCRRAIEPRKGYWTLPGGFMELNESTAQGAFRETQEETGAHIQMESLFTMVDVPQAGQVHLFYLASLKDLDWSPGEETLEQRLFKPEDIPWNDLSFTTVKSTLAHWVNDVKLGQLEFHRYTLS